MGLRTLADSQLTRNTKSSLSTLPGDQHDPDTTSRLSSSKRYGSGSTHSSRSNGFRDMAPLSTAGIPSSTAGASAAFGLGSGAFSSFGSVTKTPKTPGTSFDYCKTSSEKKEKLSSSVSTRSGSVSTKNTINGPSDGSKHSPDPSVPWSLRYSWVIWYRPPMTKNSDYEKSTKAMCKISTAQDFWKVFSHLKRPSALPAVSDYHLFKDGIRPVWEDLENKKGGKWILRLKKGVSDRYWEEILMAMIGDQFAEAAEEVCGAVLSVRPGEDVFSIWTKNDGGRNIKIREIVKRILQLPVDTNIIWKSHDDSITQRTALDQVRQEKTQQEKRRPFSMQGDGHSPKDKLGSGATA